MIKKDGKRILASVLSAALAISLINYKVDVKAADKVLNPALTGVKNVSAEAKQADITSKAGSLDPKSDTLKAEEDKQVRVIVELDKTSVLDEANKRNMSLSSLSESFKEEKKKELKSEQEEVIAEIKKSNIEADTSDVRNYDTVFNGVALGVRAGDIDKLDDLNGVKNVYISEEFERPLLTSSDEMTGAAFAGNLDYKGEGTVVAVIDSGLDYNHKAFTLDNESKARLSEADVNKLIEEKG